MSFFIPHLTTILEIYSSPDRFLLPLGLLLQTGLNLLFINICAYLQKGRNDSFIKYTNLSPECFP
jgi:hypothetical protein